MASFLGEVIEHLTQLIRIFFEDLLGQSESLFIFYSLWLVLDSQSCKVGAEGVFQLWRECLQVVSINAACVLDEGCSCHSFEELALKNNLQGVMCIFSIGSVFFDLLLFFNFIIIFVIGDVVLGGSFLLRLLLCFGRRRLSNTVQLVELCLVFWSKKCEMVLDTVVVNPIELSNGWVGRNHLSIS